jgi:hypothetical protein
MTTLQNLSKLCQRHRSFERGKKLFGMMVTIIFLLSVDSVHFASMSHITSRAGLEVMRQKQDIKQVYAEYNIMS